jgi:glutamate--cysteine ligase
MARDTVDLEPISRNGLVEWIAAGEKRDGVFRIGTEHEKFPFYRADNTPVPYAGPRGISAILEGLRQKTGWEPIIENGNCIGLFDEKVGGAISLEPGGQFELSGAPLDNLHQTAVELDTHLGQINAVAAPLGIGFLGLGMSPKWSRAETPVMPKSRYRIMMAYMPKVGTLGLDMMLRTSTVQVNLDFSSEADMVKKLRVSLALQPVATALFANSPFTEGRLNGFKSFRSQIWTDTDNQRAGMLPFAFEDGFGYERYVDYALDVPMYFVKREDYHDVSGQSFRDLLNGKLASMPGERATKSDWVNHVSTIFPEVRLKRYLEMRGADMGDRDSVLALSAFWVGLLYNAEVLDAAWDLVKGWTAEERQKLREDAPRLGLAAEIRGRPMRELAADCVRLAQAGLEARGHADAAGLDERQYLDILAHRINTGRVAADDLIAAFNGRWGQKVDPVFRERMV